MPAVTPVPVITINGTDVSRYVLKPSVRITRTLGSPYTMTLVLKKLSGLTVPTSLQEIVLGMGDITNRYFAGHILSVTEQQRWRGSRYPRYQLQCVDYSWQFDWRTVSGKRWVNTSATTIIQDMVSAFAPNFTTTHVAVGLPSTDFQSNHEERPSQFLNRLMTLIGGSAHIDYNRDIHAFVTDEAWKVPTAISSSSTTVWDLAISKDRSQVRTRARVVGGSASTTTDVAVGATSIPVDDTTLFGSSGGSALVGANEITYTGKSVSTGAGSLTGVPGSGTGSIVTAIDAGDTVRVLGKYEDSAAAAALAAVVGSGDGYVTFSLDDGNMGNTAAVAAATANVAKYSGIDTRASFKCRDLEMFPGTYVSINLTNPTTGATIASGSFKVLEVVVSDFDESNNVYPVHTVQAGQSLVDFSQLVGGGGGAQTGVTVAAAGGVGLIRPVWHLGGSGAESVQSATPTWVSASSSAIRVWIDPARRSGSVDAVVYARVRALDAGVSVTPRLYNVTNASVAGTGALQTSTSWVNVQFSVTLGAGLCEYELQLLPGTANADVQGTGILQ